MSFLERYGRTALVAGASEGLGAAYAMALAGRGMDLVLLARRAGVLDATASEVRSRYGVRVWTVPCDLADPDAVTIVSRAIGDVSVDFLVYNAALSYIGPFLETNLDTHRGITAVNMSGLLSFVYHFGGRMVERRKGGIVIMSSLAGFQGSGYLATYAATKAFCRVLGEGLWYEWKGLGVDVISCCAGSIGTPNYFATDPGKAGAMEPRPQSPGDVAEACLKKIGRTPSFVSGGGNRFAAFLMQRVFSRKQAVSIMGEEMRKKYGVG